MIGNWLRGLGKASVGLLAFALMAAPAAARQEAAAAPEPRPAIWLLADEDTKIYLLGTMHVLPPDLRWRSAAVDRLIGEADELVTETGGDKGPEDDALAMIGPMLLGKQSPILARVSPPYRQRLRDAIAASGIPADVYDGLHTWGAGFLLMSAHMMAQFGTDENGEPRPITGVETELEEEFRANGRPILGVESASEQIDFFATMPFSLQRAFLESVIEDFGMDGDTESAGDVGGPWLVGDVDGLAEEMAKLPGGIYDILLTRRNEAWARWLIERLERPGTVLFAVGAGHLVGPDSVQAALARHGFETVRID